MQQTSSLALSLPTLNPGTNKHLINKDFIIVSLKQPESDSASLVCSSPEFSKCQTWWTVPPCEDILPAYNCTLFREGYVFIKQEFDELAEACADRRWKRVYLKVEGTKVSLDYGSVSRRFSSVLAMMGIGSNANSRSLPNYIRTLTIERAILLPAEEYARTCPYAFRMLLINGEQFLIKTNNGESAIAWTEALRAAINIAPDLDRRREPHHRIYHIFGLNR